MQKRRFGWMAAAVAVAAMGSADVAAAQGKQSPLKWVDINALVSTRYMYSFDRPVNDEVVNRVVDKRDNSFAIDTASLFVSRMEEGESFGFGLALDFGDAASAYAAQRRGGFEDSDEFELREAFLVYNLPFAGISVKAGKFATLLGYEVMKTNTSFNHNISHSMLFGFAVPFTHTGILVSAPIGEQVSVDVGVVNGWDSFDDNNSGKTLLAGIGFDPIDTVSLYAAGTYGSEQDPRDRGGAGAGVKRGTATLNATIAATEQLALAFDAVYGNDSDLVPVGNGFEDADWYGAAAYAIFDIDEQWSVALRAEVFDDEGVRGNFPNTGKRVTIWEITPTVAFRLNEYVMFRAEYRHDEASDRIFAKANGRSQRGWDTIAGEILVGF